MSIKVEEIRWGIIGAGDVCEVKSGPAMNKIKNSKLVAVMRRNSSKAQDYAQRHGVPKWYDDADKLINDPEVVLADEPTGNLDSRTSIEIMGIFQQLNERGITIVMVTHEQDIAAYAQRNVVMRDGVVLSDKVVTQPLNAAREIEKVTTSASDDGT